MATVNLLNLVGDIWNQEVTDDFAAEVMMNCTAFPFGQINHWREQLTEVAFAVNFSTDPDAAICWATAELDRVWKEMRTEREPLIKE